MIVLILGIVTSVNVAAGVGTRVDVALPVGEVVPDSTDSLVGASNGAAPGSTVTVVAIVPPPGTLGFDMANNMATHTSNTITTPPAKIAF